MVPEWFVRETGAPTHTVRGANDFGREVQTFSQAWELSGQQPPPDDPPALHPGPGRPPVRLEGEGLLRLVLPGVWATACAAPTE